MTLEPPHDILSHITGRFALLPNDAVIGVAVSGGSDSVALLLALRATLEAILRFSPPSSNWLTLVFVDAVSTGSA